ncbi:MAG: ATP-binding protein [Chlamydiales bacterium]
MEREILHQLIHWKNRLNRKPLIIKGARQVGKTFILQKFGEQEFDRFHYFNFEKDPKLADAFQADLDPKRIIQDLSFHKKIKIELDKDLIIFDEIQNCPQALTSLKYFYEEFPASFICSAGSLLGIYLGPVSFPVGKVEHLPMYPMTFLEFLKALDDELSIDLLQNTSLDTQIPILAHDHLWQLLKHYFIVGGLPEVVEAYKKHQDNLFTAFEQVRKTQANLIEDYLSDIAKHSGKINAMHINRIWRSVSEQLGLAQDGSAQKFKFKGVVPGIDRFSKLANAIDWLEAAGLVIKVHIAHQSKLPLKSFVNENTFKLFLFDVGILGAMMNLSPSTILQYNYGTYKGFFAENYVAQCFEAVHPGPLFSWSEKTAEVEFVRQVEDQIIPIEVKSGWVTKSKSLRAYAQKYHPPFRVILSAHPLSIDQKKQVHHYPLYLASHFPLR